MNTHNNSGMSNPLRMSNYINPVSYTHLDVYKRQVWGGARAETQRQFYVIDLILLLSLLFLFRYIYLRFSFHFLYFVSFTTKFYSICVPFVKNVNRDYDSFFTTITCVPVQFILNFCSFVSIRSNICFKRF